MSAIVKDINGRLSSDTIHPLKQYPISSTIKVVMKSNKSYTELKRGKDWSYDASMNSITFSGVVADRNDYLAISYVIWQKKD